MTEQQRGQEGAELAAIVSDEQIARIHGHANFGSMSPRDVVNDGVRKVAVGYHCGHTQFTILREHGLINKPPAGSYDTSLTKKGKAYARVLFGMDQAIITAWKRRAPPEAEASPPLATDEGGCVTKRFVIFTTPGWAPQKKGGWFTDEHLIDFLRDVMLHDGWKPGFQATVLELTWDNDIWASSASEYLGMHDAAIGPRRARAAWKVARSKHEAIYKTAPTAKLGTEFTSFHRLTDVRQALAVVPAQQAEAPADAPELAACRFCKGQGWVEDQNWSARYPDIVQDRVEGNGLIRCGWCLGDGIDPQPQTAPISAEKG